MDDTTRQKGGQQSVSSKHPQRLFDVLNRHRLKLGLLIVGMALMVLLADAILKGSAY